MTTVHPDDLPRVTAAVEASMREGKPYEVEYRSMQQDGSVRWILGKGHVVRSDSGRVVRLTGVALDVTGRRRADQALRESEERLRMAKEAAGLGIWDWDIRTGSVQWTPEIYEFVGLDPAGSDITLERWKAFAHPDDRDRVLAEAEAAIANSEPLRTEFRVVRTDGDIRWLLARGRTISDDSGAPVRMVGVNMDVTERRSIEEKLRQSNAELEQYAYAASHDLQEPLRVVMLYSQLLLRRHNEQFDSEARKHLDQIMTGASRMQMLIEDLLSYSKIVSGRDRVYVPVNMNLVAKIAEEACRAAIQESNGSVLCGDLPVLHGDVHGLTGVLQNLLSNAVKYRRKDVPPEVSVEARREGEFWHFCVSDNGIGINPAYHARIFGVFKRLHGRDVPGTGIGLAICKRTVEQHGGRIWVESEEGEGAAFHFTLPAAQASADAAGSAP
jgi:PAS domain S-box-containing protein